MSWEWQHCLWLQHWGGIGRRNLCSRLAMATQQGLELKTKSASNKSLLPWGSLSNRKDENWMQPSRVTPQGGVCVTEVVLCHTSPHCWSKWCKVQSGHAILTWHQLTKYLDECHGKVNSHNRSSWSARDTKAGSRTHFCGNVSRL